MERMKAAEKALLSWARNNNNDNEQNVSLESIDTEIPISVVPLRDRKNEKLTMHSLHVQSNNNNNSHDNNSSITLVLLHGYMNGALFYYRNVVGLSKYFRHVYAVDFLGWGSSSRPAFWLKDDSVETTESFFVDSLESWRIKNRINKMVLAGHSLGGYLAVAYAEKYPERVDRLVLLSPVGVPDGVDEKTKQTRGLRFGVLSTMWKLGITPGLVLRSDHLFLIDGKARVEEYVKDRLTVIRDVAEQGAFAEYAYTNLVLPGSGEHGLCRILHPGAWAKKSLLHRIPQLKVGHVSFFYGTNDFMDAKAGAAVERACKRKEYAPTTSVWTVRDAGHMLTIENAEEVNSGIVAAVFGEDVLPNEAPRPVRYCSETV